MVIEPSQEVFDGLMDMMAQKGSWDGADQGSLNGRTYRISVVKCTDGATEFFPNWNRLSFLYNSTPSAHYTYAPAYRKNGDDVFVVHFIGKGKETLRYQILKKLNLIWQINLGVRNQARRRIQQVITLN